MSRIDLSFLGVAEVLELWGGGTGLADPICQGTLRPEKECLGGIVPPPVSENKGALSELLFCRGGCSRRQQAIWTGFECTLKGQAGALSTATVLELWESEDRLTWLRRSPWLWPPQGHQTQVKALNAQLLFWENILILLCTHPLTLYSHLDLQLILAASKFFFQKYFKHT